MAVFVELTTDPFEETRERSAAWQRSRLRTGSAARNVRRPTRGLEIKRETHAILKVIDSKGRPISLVDSGRLSGEAGQGYGNFLLQSVSEARAEKAQIVETFGEAFVYFYGAAPRFLDIRAILINSADFPWPAEWWENYEEHFRGTRLAERGARSYLFYDDHIVEAYVMTCSAAAQAESPHVVELAFRLFVTNHQTIRVSGEASVAQATIVELPPFGSEVLGGPAVIRPQSSVSPASRVDEYMAPPSPEAQSPAGGPRLARARGAPPESTSELVETSVTELSHYGADVNNPGALAALGLGSRGSTSGGPESAASAGFSAAVSSGQALNMARATREPDPLTRVFGASYGASSSAGALTVSTVAAVGSGTNDGGAARPATTQSPAERASAPPTAQRDVLPEPFALVVLPGVLALPGGDSEHRDVTVSGLRGAASALGLTGGASRAGLPAASTQSHAYERRASLP